MEFSSGQIVTLNRLLPNRFKIELLTKTNGFQSLKPESTRQISTPNIPAKRVQSETLDLIPKKLPEGSSKLVKIITELKNHEKFPLFIQHFQPSPNHPTSLPLIETRVLQGKYKQLAEFALEVRQVWNFSFSQNVGRQDLYSATVDLSHFFETQLLKHEQLLNKSSADAGQAKEVQKNEEVGKKLRTSPSQVKKSTQSTGKDLQYASGLSKTSERAERALGFMEKRNLCQNIRKLEPKYFAGMFEIVKECHNLQGQEVEIDLETLPAKVARDLDRYVKLCLSKCSKGKKNTVEQMKKAELQASVKLSDLNDEKAKSPTEKPCSEKQLKESSSESSSTSESEEEVPESLGLSSCSV